MNIIDNLIIFCMIITIVCIQFEEYLLDSFRYKCLNTSKGRCVLTKHYNFIISATTYEENIGGKVIHLYMGDTDNRRVLEIFPFILPQEFIG
jgi:hypothetical protein